MAEISAKTAAGPGAAFAYVFAGLAEVAANAATAVSDAGADRHADFGDEFSEFLTENFYCLTTGLDAFPERAARLAYHSIELGEASGYGVAAALEPAAAGREAALEFAAQAGTAFFG